MSASDAFAPWSPTSWRALPIKQQPNYRDARALEQALREVRRLPPLVAPEEFDELRPHLAQVARGERFLLQGGDCAERFVTILELQWMGATRMRVPSMREGIGYRRSARDIFSVGALRRRK
jgi:3-deoxy-D-arabino-heptulosonate 7-phosphate (DAHP) synthase class II